MMDREIKKLWVEALRSGHFKQAKGRLVDDGAYCCLGVLCVVQGATDLYAEFEGGVTRCYVGERFSAGLARDEQNTLGGKNDGGWSFSRIADYIEAHY